MKKVENQRKKQLQSTKDKMKVELENIEKSHREGIEKLNQRFESIENQLNDHQNRNLKMKTFSMIILIILVSYHVILNHLTVNLITFHLSVSL